MKGRKGEKEGREGEREEERRILRHEGEMSIPTIQYTSSVKTLRKSCLRWEKCPLREPFREGGRR